MPLSFEVDLDGIIPAGAGRSKKATSSPSSARDHPRGCGEKVSLAVRVLDPQGSSPRVRGEDADVAVGLDDLGIIPAGAGRRRGAVLWGGISGDHPRGCGEKLME